MAHKISKYKPKNLEEVPSAIDISNFNAPPMLHNKSPMERIKEESTKQEQISYRKILGGIQKIMNEPPQVRVRTQKNYRPNPKEMMQTTSQLSFRP